MKAVWRGMTIEICTYEAVLLGNRMSSTIEVRKRASWDGIVHHKVWVVSLCPEPKPWFPSWQVLKTQQMSRLQLWTEDLWVRQAKKNTVRVKT